jgi:hypothetical protein
MTMDSREKLNRRVYGETAVEAPIRQAVGMPRARLQLEWTHDIDESGPKAWDAGMANSLYFAVALSGA